MQITQVNLSHHMGTISTTSPRGLTGLSCLVIKVPAIPIEWMNSATLLEGTYIKNYDYDT